MTTATNNQIKILEAKKAECDTAMQDAQDRMDSAEHDGTPEYEQAFNDYRAAEYRRTDLSNQIEEIIYHPERF